MKKLESLAEYLWMSFILYIQDKDNEVDNLDFVRNIANVWYKCDKNRMERRQDETI